MRETVKKKNNFKEVAVDGKKFDVWTFINSITFDKKTEYNEETKGVYSAYMINKALSMFPDTVIWANEMNRYGGLIPDDVHYAFLINTVTPKKRFSKWPKRSEAEGEDIETVQRYYGYNEKKAKDAISILGDDGIAIIKQKQEKGGT